MHHEVAQALAQPFFYLGRGRQSFVFESQDHKYVLKLPRLDRYRTKLWMRCLAKNWARASTARKEMRKAFVFNSFQIAAQELREETALLYLHLGKTEHLPKLLLHDRMGRSFFIPLNDQMFVLQRKIPLAFPLLKEHLAQKDARSSQEMVDKFLDLLLIRAKKRIFNRDSNFFANFGYAEGKFYQIDLGSFHKKDQNEKTCFMEGVHQIRSLIAEDDALCQWLDLRAEALCDTL
ncbi:MAG: hypothetical protein HY069_05040 [Chlamydiia bacterium]|nr:hypothetical protein [Chlamydiia bacterium]